MQSSAIEITQEEYESRRITTYGRMQGIIDQFTLFLLFGMSTMILTVMIPAAESIGEVWFWLILQVFFVVSGLKKLERIWNPMDFYQTLIVRKG
jgi:hypothetical protein